MEYFTRHAKRAEDDGIPTWRIAMKNLSILVPVLATSFSVRLIPGSPDVRNPTANHGGIHVRAAPLRPERPAPTAGPKSTSTPPAARSS